MMKALMGAAALALLATPALAQNATFNVSVNASVPPTCAASTAFLRTVSGDAASAAGVNAGGSSNFAADLNNADAQLIGSLTARCNTGTANVSLNTNNGFKLVNGAGGANREIPYALNLSGGGGATGITAPHTGIVGGTGPAAQQSRALSFDLAAAIDPTTLWAGAYSDTIVATFSPRP